MRPQFGLLMTTAFVRSVIAARMAARSGRKSASVGTFTVSHGFSFGTASGTVGSEMYCIKYPIGDAFTLPDTINQKYFQTVVTVAPCTVEVWPNMVIEDA